MFDNWTPSKNYVIDTRVDNIGYWKRLAELGLIPYNPVNNNLVTTYTGNGLPCGPPSTDIKTIGGTTNTQSENSINVNPTNAGVIIQSNNSTNYPVTTIYGANDLYSGDFGATWNGTTAGAGGSNSGDPAAVISRNGRYYIGYINSAYGQSVSWATNIAGPWTPVVAGTSTNMNDKNHMWCDVSSTSPYVNYLYDAWTQFGTPNTNQIEIVRSTNGGLNWSAKLNISSTLNAGSHNQGVNICTGPAGQVYVFWTIYDSWPSYEGTYAFSKSLDGGVTFVSTRFLTGCKGVRSTSLIDGIRTNSFPSACCNISNCANSGAIYMVWANQGVPGVNTGSDIDIYIVRSTNQGTNWSTPIRVTNDPLNNGKKAWFPWITCDPTTGALSVVFYDDRNCSAGQAETWVANSFDGGTTWDNFKVSDVAFTPSPIPGLAGGYMGDYLGITAMNSNVYPCWSDNRTAPHSTYVSPYTNTPVVNIAITSGSNPTCAGASVTFTATPGTVCVASEVYSAANLTYQWQVNGGNVGTNNPVYTTTTLTNGQIVTCKLTVCGNAQVTSNAITMVVNTSFVPSVSIAITSGSNPSCAGSSVTFTATPTNGGSNPSYQWKVNGGNVGTNSPTYTTTTLTNGQIVTCVMTSNLACAVPTTATSNAITMTINPVVVPSVSIVITSGSNPCCAGTSVTFTATPTNGGTTPSYQWKVNGGNVGTNSSTYTTTTLANGDIVTCVMTSNATCANPTTATSNAITMIINAVPPKPTITQNLSVLTSSAPVGNQWYLNMGIIPGATNQTYTVTVNGSYTVQVTLNGCASPMSDPIVINNVGLYDMNNTTKTLSIVPNPSNGNFTVSFYANGETNIIKIIDNLGKTVFKEVIAFKGQYSKQINIESFGKGVYTIILTNTKSETYKKVVIY